MQEEKVNLLGVDVSITNVPKVIKYIINNIESGRASILSYVNVHSYYLSFKDKNFKALLNRSNMVFCDGFGVKVAARLLGVQLGDRMTPPDWIDELFIHCQKHHIIVFFLGDEDHVISAFVQKVKNKYPSLLIAGYHHGFFNAKPNGNSDILRLVNNSKAQLVITGMGSPLQERWAFDNRSKLGNVVVLGTGAMFRWYANIERRGPKIFTTYGFEWLWRLFVQPRRVWKRYIIELPYFFFIVLKTKFSN